MGTKAVRERTLEEARARLRRLEAAGMEGLDAAGLRRESLALAAEVQRLALWESDEGERRRAERIERMVADSPGRALTTALTDQLFRARDTGRVAVQVQRLLSSYGIPDYLSTSERFLLRVFRAVGPLVPGLSVPAVLARVAQETRQVVLPGEPEALGRHLAQLTAEGARVNLNHLGEAILGEAEATARLQLFLEDIARPNVACVSVKISAICSQLNLLAWEDTLTLLTERTVRLLHAARQRAGVPGQVAPLVYLDMEEYRDLHLTVALFRRLMDRPELLRATAGIVLQAYLPDSWGVQQELTRWARARVERGGAPLRLRIVKGANLAMERVEASLHGWPQAPYPTKAEVDANFKRMAAFGTRADNARVLRLGVATHNVFDLAHAMVLRAAQGSADNVGFEMLEGMAEPVRRVVQELTGDVLVYAPAVAADDIQSAIAYLIRRFDENTGPENFLGRCAAAAPESEVWREEAERFAEALAAVETVSSAPRRTQDRSRPAADVDPAAPFANEPDTDWSLPHNRAWIEAEVARGVRVGQVVLLVVAGETLEVGPAGMRSGHDPSRPGVELYRTALADEALVDRALEAARAAAERWGATPLAERARILARAAGGLRRARGELVVAMLADGGKAIVEGDREVSEAVDFAEYYPRSLAAHLASGEIAAAPLGVVVVAPPWNFPLAIAAGGALAALAAGNAVILKPAPETALVGHRLAEVLWAAGVPRDVLQLLHCADEPVGSRLIADERVDAVVLTGGTATARHFMALRPKLRLFAETGGKNAIVLDALSDRDLAIKQVLASAFGHAGQKCSAVSLLIAEAEVYDDEAFRRRLADAAASLPVGSAWEASSVVTPLIGPPRGALLRGLTTLEPGESWLLEPRQRPENPALWSPGVKLGTNAGSFTHQTELFGPVLALMRASDLEEATRLANATPYGLTAGLMSLDGREHARWLGSIDAGNCYINRTTTGAIVQRQPFGGRRGSSFGPGTKAGGPDYVLQLCRLRDAGAPESSGELAPRVGALLEQLRGLVDAGGGARLGEAAGSYALAWRRWFSRAHDPVRLLGQDNQLRYQARPGVLLRAEADAPVEAVGRVMLAAATAGVPTRLSLAEAHPLAGAAAGWGWSAVVEEARALARRLDRSVRYLRLLGGAGGEVPFELWEAAARLDVAVDRRAPLACGRVEVGRLLLEQAISVDYHRYGNLGAREAEARSPVA